MLFKYCLKDRSYTTMEQRETDNSHRRARSPRGTKESVPYLCQLQFKTPQKKSKTIKTHQTRKSLVWKVLKCIPLQYKKLRKEPLTNPSLPVRQNYSLQSHVQQGNPRSWSKLNRPCDKSVPTVGTLIEKAEVLIGPTDFNHEPVTPVWYYEFESKTTNLCSRLRSCSTPQGLCPPLGSNLLD